MNKNRVRGKPIAKVSKILLNNTPAQDSNTHAIRVRKIKSKRCRKKSVKWNQFNTEKNLQIIAAKRQLGWTDEQLIAFIGIAESTFYDWKKKHSEFSEALKDGKEYADTQIQNAMYERAIGIEKVVYKGVLAKKVTYNSSGKRIKEEQEVKMVPETIFVPPDPRCLMFWMTNRTPEDWKQKQQTELSGSISVDADINLEERLIKARSVGNESGNSIEADGHIGIPDA